MIKLEGVSKSLKKNMILEDVNLTFEKGNIYLLRGHNGSGKTMLLRMLCGLLKPDAGMINIEIETFGVMIENPAFVLHETARENLKFLAGIQKKIDMPEIDAVLDQVNLLKVADKKVKTFSLGMKQRLGFAQAIMENPDALLLDEPFNALDDEHFHLMLDTILKMKKDKIIVVAAHGFDVVKYPILDQVLTMSNGKVTNIESFNEGKRLV